MFTPGYGYIWASAYPWGYMPFQCGARGTSTADLMMEHLMGGCNLWWSLQGFDGGPNIGYALWRICSHYASNNSKETAGQRTGPGVPRPSQSADREFNPHGAVNRPLIINGAKVQDLSDTLRMVFNRVVAAFESRARCHLERRSRVERQTVRDPVTAGRRVYFRGRTQAGKVISRHFAGRARVTVRKRKTMREATRRAIRLG